jgi:hypothetical protein
MWNKAKYETFQTGLKAILGGTKNTGDDQLVRTLVDYLERQCGPIDRRWATEDVREHLAQNRDTIADRVIEWAEELASGIRWPVAYAYTVTGKLADYCENTTVIVVVVDRDGKVLGHDVVHWSDFSGIRDEKECYTALNRAIDDCAIRLGARCIFDFDCAGKLTKSVSVAHHPEQGASLFNERYYGEDSVKRLAGHDVPEPA